MASKPKQSQPKPQVAPLRQRMQSAAKHPGGRPRTVSPEPEDCISLGQEMVAWVMANKPTHLSEWFSIEKMITWKEWNAMCELPEFLPYYEIALSLVAKNARDGTLDKSLAQRFLALYHRDLRKYDHEELKVASDLKKQENQTFAPEDLERIKNFMESISRLQK